MLVRVLSFIFTTLGRRHLRTLWVINYWWLGVVIDHVYRDLFNDDFIVGVWPCGIVNSLILTFRHTAVVMIATSVASFWNLSLSSFYSRREVEIWVLSDQYTFFAKRISFLECSRSVLVSWWRFREHCWFNRCGFQDSVLLLLLQDLHILWLIRMCGLKLWLLFFKHVLPLRRIFNRLRP